MTIRTKIAMTIGLAISCIGIGVSQSKTGAAKTSAPCSPATTGDNNTLTINCTINMVSPEAPNKKKAEGVSAEGPIFSDAVEYNVQAGGLSGTLGPNQKSMCLLQTPSGRCPLNAVIENGSLKMFATLYSNPGNGDVTVEGNVLHKKIAKWDRCFDNSSLEVVDDKENPVFQMTYTTPTDIVVKGIFRDHGETLVVTETTLAFYRDASKAPDHISLSKLFKYPSRTSNCEKAN